MAVPPDSESLLVAALPVMAGLVALMLAAIFSRLVSTAGPVDAPRKRGNHDCPTPTSGGMAMIAATSLGLGLGGMLLPGPGLILPQLVLLYLMAALMGASGALDDWLGLSPRLRLGIQIVMCGGFAALFPVTELSLAFGQHVNVWAPVAVLATTVWLILVVNAVNFMDGINGLAAAVQAEALMALIAAVVLLGPVPLSITGRTLVLIMLFGAALGAQMGMLPFNLPFGRVFQGDAGALFYGTLIGGGVVVLAGLGIVSAWFGGFILAPFLVDVIMTLNLRLMRKEPIFEAHRQHLYQVWVARRDPSHARLSLKVAGLTLISSVIGLGTEMLVHLHGSDLRLPGLCLVFGALGSMWLRLRERLDA